jgi:hypothetical protein
MSISRHESLKDARIEIDPVAKSATAFIKIRNMDVPTANRIELFASST